MKSCGKAVSRQEVKTASSRSDKRCSADSRPNGVCRQRRKGTRSSSHFKSDWRGFLGTSRASSISLRALRGELFTRDKLLSPHDVVVCAFDGTPNGDKRLRYQNAAAQGINAHSDRLLRYPTTIVAQSIRNTVKSSLAKSQLYLPEDSRLLAKPKLHQVRTFLNCLGQLQMRERQMSGFGFGVNS